MAALQYADQDGARGRGDLRLRAGLKGSIGDRSNHSNFCTSEFRQISCQNSGKVLTFLQKILKF